MNTDPPHLYRETGRRLGRDEATLAQAVQQMGTLAATDRPAILSLKHLALLTDCDYLYLRRIVQRKEDPYTDVRRPRRCGELTRPIAAPQPPLMRLQRWLLKSVLGCLSPSPYAYAYVPGRSALACAQRHLGARWVIKLDVRHFFHGINEPSVYAVFRGIGYNPLVSLELARLTTRMGLQGVDAGALHERYSTITSYSGKPPGFLAQGAPTSGALANEVCRPLDDSLASIAREADVVFTRYSDDLTFSTGARNFGRADAVALLQRVSGVVSSHGFQLNKEKTRIAPPGARRIVLGLLVDGQRLRLPPELRRRIEFHLLAVDRFSLATHARARGFDSVMGFTAHLEGLLTYAQQVEPERWSEHGERWRKRLEDLGLR